MTDALPHKFDYTDLVTISPTFSDPRFSGQIGAVCGMSRGSETTRYTVEIGTGESAEVPEELLEKWTED